MKMNEEIARVAYELFEKSGRLHGRDADNWLEAEKIVLAKQKGGKKPAAAAKKVPAAGTAKRQPARRGKKAAI